MSGYVAAPYSMPGVEIDSVDGGGSATSLPILRSVVDAVAGECPSRLGISSEELQQKSPTVDVFFDVIAAERLRRMPADGSRIDSTLRRASRLAFAVASLRDAVTSFIDGAEEATKMVWGTTLLLLEVCLHIYISLDVEEYANWEYLDGYRQCRHDR